MHNFVGVFLSDSGLVDLVNTPHVLQIDRFGRLLDHEREGLGHFRIARLVEQTILSEVLE